MQRPPEGGGGEGAPGRQRHQAGARRGGVRLRVGRNLPQRVDGVVGAQAGRADGRRGRPARREGGHGGAVGGRQGRRPGDRGGGRRQAEGGGRGGRHARAGGGGDGRVRHGGQRAGRCGWRRRRRSRSGTSPTPTPSATAPTPTPPPGRQGGQAALDGVARRPGRQGQVGRFPHGVRVAAWAGRLPRGGRRRGPEGAGRGLREGRGRGGCGGRGRPAHHPASSAAALVHGQGRKGGRPRPGQARRRRRLAPAAATTPTTAAARHRREGGPAPLLEVGRDGRAAHMLAPALGRPGRDRVVGVRVAPAGRDAGKAFGATYARQARRFKGRGHPPHHGRRGRPQQPALVRGPPRRARRALGRRHVQDQGVHGRVSGSGGGDEVGPGDRVQVGAVQDDGPAGAEDGGRGGDRCRALAAPGPSFLVHPPPVGRVPLRQGGREGGLARTRQADQDEQGGLGGAGRGGGGRGGGWGRRRQWRWRWQQHAAAGGRGRYRRRGGGGTISRPRPLGRRATVAATPAPAAAGPAAQDGGRAAGRLHAERDLDAP